uniref:Uncharacterized protein n=1 Tax=Pararge aegeria TaxID=116150 RepID=S4NM16_9NEOP
MLKIPTVSSYRRMNNCVHGSFEGVAEFHGVLSSPSATSSDSFVSTCLSFGLNKGCVFELEWSLEASIDFLSYLPARTVNSMKPVFIY